jgi:hypothetical protein
LFSCWAGNSGKGFAQNLSNKLGVQVLAPNRTVTISEFGRIFTPGGEKLKLFEPFIPGQ